MYFDNVTTYSTLTILESNEETDRQSSGISPTYVVTRLVTSLVGMISIILNMFVLRCFCKVTVLRNVTVSFLLHNAVADILIGIFTIYHEVYNLILFTNLQECIFRNSCICGTIVGSVFIILGLNFERYLQITQPFRYTYVIRPWIVKSYLALAWILVTGLIVAPPIFWMRQPPVNVFSLCGFFIVMTKDFIKAVCISSFIIIFLQVAMYIHIFYVAVSKIRQDKRRIEPTETKKSLQIWWKPVKVVIIIVGVNVFALCPVVIYMTLVSEGWFDDYSDKDKEIMLSYFATPCFTNSVLNPILYSFQVPEIKKAFREVFCCTRRNDSVASS